MGLGAMGRSNGIARDSRPLINTTLSCDFHVGVTLEGARKMTQERKRKISLANRKKRLDEMRRNPPPLPEKMVLMLKYRDLWPPKGPREKDEFPVSTDDVYSLHNHTWPRYQILEALNKLRDLYDPTVLDDPKAFLKLKVEFNMTGSKSTRFLESFTRMIPVYHKYNLDIPSKSLCLFIPEGEREAEMKAIAEKFEVTLVGSPAKMADDITKGNVEITNIDYFLAHQDCATEMKPLTGILRDKVPTTRDGTISSDLENLIKTYQDGIVVDVNKVKKSLTVLDEPDYGFCVFEIARLDMSDEEIVANINGALKALSIKNIITRKSDSKFITRCQMFVDESYPIKYDIHHELVNDHKGKKFLEREVYQIPAESASSLNK